MKFYTYIMLIRPRYWNLWGQGKKGRGREREKKRERMGGSEEEGGRDRDSALVKR